MSSLVFVIISGFTATLVMIAIMELTTRAKLANADMIRAIGSIITKSYENALTPGLLIHFSSGIFFAIIYFYAFGFLLPNKPNLAPVAGLAFGFFHGIVVTLSVVNLISKHHPLKKFQETGLYMALAHIIGHIVYGLSVGVMYSIFN